MKTASFPALALLLCLLSTAPSAASTVIPPADLGELARRSDAVVLAQASRSQARETGMLIHTRTRFDLLVVVSGPLRAGESIDVECPGGTAGEESWIVFGSPRFNEGESYLLFLQEKRPDLWMPALLAHGVLRDWTTAQGETVLQPLHPESAGAIAVEPLDATEPLTVYDRDALLVHLGEIVRGRSAWTPGTVVASEEAVAAFQRREKAPPGICSFFESGGRRFRWRTFDTGGRATIYADDRGDSSLAGGALKTVQDAIDLWHGISGTGINIEYGGLRPRSESCSGGASQSNLIVFDDPCGEMGALDNCSGTLAFGGPRTSGSHSFDGDSWLTITSWIVVVNDGSGCIGESNYARLLAHELGHGLGFGHVDDSGALMYANCCRNVNSTDTTCARYTYPAIDPTNARPVVDAGDDVDLFLARNLLQLEGEVRDDGPLAALEVEWEQLAGPQPVTFSTPGLPRTEVRFATSGSYLFALTAYDGELLAADLVEVDVSIWSTSDATLSFQQGVSGYSGTLDTTLSEDEPTASRSRSASLGVDGDTPSGSGLVEQTLLRFQDVFGNDPRQIPAGSTIRSATLELFTTNSGDGAEFYRLRREWDENVSWSSFGDGVRPGDAVFASADTFATGPEGTVSVDVTASVQAWSEAPCDNFGWALLPRGDDGWDFDSAEGTTPPRLVVSRSIVQQTPVIELGDEWDFFPGRTPPPAQWRDVSFVPPVSWPSGPSGIGFGDGDDRTVLDDMRGSYTSIFLRHDFVVPRPERIGRLLLRIDYDDGFIAYLNGVEVARSVSMGSPGTPFGHGDVALESHEAGTAELHSLDPELLLPGANVLAFQVHNAQIDSSDLSFRPELTAVFDLVDEGASWRFVRGLATPPGGWTEVEFDDGDWSVGRSGFGYGDGDDHTVLEDMANRYLSIFCRRRFTLGEPVDVDALRINVIYDDGVVVHVNGSEIGRASMPGGPVTHTTAASSGGETRLATFDVPLEILRAGDNVLAVSGHNTSLASSDFTLVPVLVAMHRELGGAVRCDGGFVRGDVNSDGRTDVGDPVTLLFHLFRGVAIDCQDAADSDDNGSLELADALSLLTHLFLGGPEPAPPAGDCGVDPVPDDLGDCDTAPCGG